MFSQTTFCRWLVILAGCFHLVIGKTDSSSKRIYQDQWEAHEKKNDVLNIDITKSPIRDHRENLNLQPEEIIDNLAKIISDLTTRLDMQGKHILSLQENIEELARSNSKNEHNLKVLNVEVSELKRVVAEKDDTLRSMHDNFTRQVEETEQIKTESAKLQNNLEEIQARVSKDESGRKGMKLKEYEYRSDQSTSRTPDFNGMYKNTSTRAKEEDEQRLSSLKITREDILLNGTTDLTNKANNYHRSVEAWTRSVSHVAFHAVVQKPNIHHLGNGQTVVFESVRLNSNGGYNRFTGIFTAPKPGLYLFSISVLSCVDPNPKFNVRIVKNGVGLANSFGEAASRKLTQGSVTVVVQLNKGDHVWAQQFYVNDASICGWGFTSFTGVLISAI